MTEDPKPKRLEVADELGRQLEDLERGLVTPHVCHQLCTCSDFVEEQLR